MNAWPPTVGARFGVAAAIALSVATPAVASPSATAATGGLTVHADGNGVGAVNLRHALRHSSSDPDLEVQVHGSGQFRGLVLLPHDRPLHAETTGLVVGWLPGAAREHPTVIVGPGNSPLPSTLPAGDYDVYIAAAGPVAVSMTLPGQSHEMNVRTQPTRAVDAVAYAASLPGDVSASPAFAAGADLQATDPGGMFSVAFIWRRASAQTSAIQGSCLYPGGAPTPVDYAVPACPDGDSAELDGVVDLRTPADTLGLSWVHLGRGTWGLKDYYVAVAAPAAAGITFLNIGTRS